MKAYILPGKKIEPFNEYPGECLIVNRPVEKARKEIFQNLGVESIILISKNQYIDDPEEHIILTDNLFFTQKLLQEFITDSQKRKRCTVCALKHGFVPIRTIIATQDVSDKSDYFEYNLRYLPKKLFRTNDYSPVIINEPNQRIGIPVPKHIYSSGEYEIPVTEKIIVQIDCWTNLWSINIALLFARTAELFNSRLKLFLLAVKSFSFNKWRILHKFNRIGKSDIHPTAYIEESIIGNNVIVGAGAVIRGSVIGNNVFVGNGVTIERSVVGKESTILSGHIMYSVLYPGVFTITQLITASLIGRNVFLGSDVTLTDFRLDGQDIIVIKDGNKVDTGNIFIGCCLGHNVYLGAGCVVSPGRVIRNNSRIAPEKVIKGDSPKNMSGFKLVKEFAEVYSLERKEEKRTKKVKVAS